MSKVFISVASSPNQAQQAAVDSAFLALRHAGVRLVFENVARPPGATGLVWLPFAREAYADGFVALAANLAQHRHKLEVRRVRRVRAIAGVSLLASLLLLASAYVGLSRRAASAPQPKNNCGLVRALTICAEQEGAVPLPASGARTSQ